jgi:hypothetical protein
MRRSILVFLVVVLSGTFCLGAQEPVNGESYYVDFCITWIQWWEANRDTYIRKAIGDDDGGSQLASSEDGSGDQHGPPKEVVAKVVAALLDATRSVSRDVRAEAALALARMGAGKDRLLELTHDDDLRVRCRAWVCLGLLQKEDELLRPTGLSDVETLAVMTGLGLLDKPGDEALQRVRTAARSANVREIQRTAIWALRVYHSRNSIKDKDGIDNSILLDVVKSSENPAVVSEAFLAMGAVGGRADIPQLIDVAHWGKRTLALPAFVHLMKIEKSPLKIGQWQMSCMRGAACLALAQINNGTSRPDGGKPAANGGVDGSMPLTATLLQENALKGLYEPGLQIGQNVYCMADMYFPGISALALPRFGAPWTLDLLLGQTDPAHNPFVNPAQPNATLAYWSAGQNRVLPQLGYAAMAMGISGGEAQKLLLFASDPNETRHFRAACVLAMGLSGEKGNAGALIQLADQLNPHTDGLVCGHVVLALGLLKDPHALEYASKFGLAGAKTIDVRQILDSKFNLSIVFRTPKEVPRIWDMDYELGVRAELLGLAILGDKRAGPALLANWGSNQWISLEAARAMGWCGVYDGVDPLIALLRQNNQQNVQAWAARSLGEMFDPDKPSKLGRLVEGEFYPYPVQGTLKWLDMTPGSQFIEHEFQGLTNPLLYWEILPRFDGRFIPPWHN